jgi:cytochrome c biogenesis protein CcmG/thiol:disulfide interchange protein DsbE
MPLARVRAFAAAVLIMGALALPAAAVEQGDKAPDFTAAGLTGGTISLADYRGKVVYLDFWASWCGPCAQALPALDALRREFPPGDFQVVAVNVDREAKSAQAFLRKRPIGYPSALDPEGAIPAQFGVEVMPTSFLIDRDGTVRHVQRGFRTDDVESLRKQIQQLVAKKGPQTQAPAKAQAQAPAKAHPPAKAQAPAKAAR